MTIEIYQENEYDDRILDSAVLKNCDFEELKILYHALVGRGRIKEIEVKITLKSAHEQEEMLKEELG